MNDETRMASPWRAAFGATMFALVIAGCSGKRGVPVEGTVTFDGQPVEEGAVSFIPADGKGASDGAVITDGKFEAVVMPGPKRVEIRASRPVPPNNNDPEAAGMRKDFIPARYNDASTLTQEISAEGGNVLKFDLK